VAPGEQAIAQQAAEVTDFQFREALTAFKGPCIPGGELIKLPAVAPIIQCSCYIRTSQGFGEISVGFEIFYAEAAEEKLDGVRGHTKKITENAGNYSLQIVEDPIKKGRAPNGVRPSLYMKPRHKTGCCSKAICGKQSLMVSGEGT